MTILDSSNELVYDKSREADLMDILGIQSMAEVSIIPWRPPATPPREGSYVIVKYYVPLFDQIDMDLFDYKNGAYTYWTVSGHKFNLRPNEVLGWAYPITYRP